MHAIKQIFIQYAVWTQISIISMLITCAAWDTMGTPPRCGRFGWAKLCWSSPCNQPPSPNISRYKKCF